ncbi:hypothetical protein [Rhodopirellula sp. SWK7]|uniref:hypothetical protein n=1 Tax=Rhodopirellula sp. SWK7 TaxID=595460 RepID=UPI0003464829|nr:hypothetical protein [Rhodopirellula sp. SWK7]
MKRFTHFAIVLFALTVVAGCGEEGGAVGTDDEIQTYIDEHGSHSSDPGPSPLTD